jgi:hypothetical protein
MKVHNISWINRAFKHALKNITDKYGIPIFEITIVIKFYRYGNFQFIVCHNEKPIVFIRLDTLMNQKMAALGFNTATIERMVNMMHQSFLRECKLKDPKEISLILYESPKEDCCCVGVVHQTKVLRVMRLYEVIECMDLGVEQLN